VHEVDALGDVTLQALHGGLEEYLLVLVDAGQWVQGLLGSAGLLVVRLESVMVRR
jgi:hypothetical protein